MSDLLPCPFCGGQAEIHATHDVDTGEIDGWFAWCNNKRCECKPETNDYCTEAEAVDAWNKRAAYEIEGFFYLPKPKQQLFGYTTGFSFDDLSLKATGAVDVYALANAIRKWQEEELNQHIVDRICEVFKPERTCKNVDDAAECGYFKCSECNIECSIEWCYSGYGAPNYCPNCGARVIAGD